MRQRLVYFVGFLLMITISVGMARPRNGPADQSRDGKRFHRGFEGLKFAPGVELKCDATECQRENIKALLLTLATPPKGSKVDTASLVGSGPVS